MMLLALSVTIPDGRDDPLPQYFDNVCVRFSALLAPPSDLVSRFTVFTSHAASMK